MASGEEQSGGGPIKVEIYTLTNEARDSGAIQHSSATANKGNSINSEAEPHIFRLKTDQKPLHATASVLPRNIQESPSFDSLCTSLDRCCRVSGKIASTSGCGCAIAAATSDHGSKDVEKVHHKALVASSGCGPAEPPSFRATVRSNTFGLFSNLVGGLVRPKQQSNRNRKTLFDQALKQEERRYEWSRKHSQSLEDRLTGASLLSPLTSQDFIPKSCLESLITQASVEKELARLKHLPAMFAPAWIYPRSIAIRSDRYRASISGLQSRSTTDLLALKIYRKIFAILMLIGHPAALPRFIEEGICDADLPLLRVHGTGKGSYEFELRGRRFTKVLSCFRGWGLGSVEKFLERQWMLLPATFKSADENGIPHHEFDSSEILPFVCWEEASDEGGSGQVYKAKIHGDYHSFRTSQIPNGFVAVKRLRPRHHNAVDNKHAFFQESNILKNLSKTGHMHRHLIVLLATFHQSNRYHLVFPWAEADLEGYWRRTPRPPTRDHTAELWLIEQCQGIAEALKTVHSYKTLSNSTMLLDLERPQKALADMESSHGSLILLGRHGDIKPENILWFPDDSSIGGLGTLKVTDFGIARFTAENKVQKREKGYVPNSVTYRSPECDLLDEEVSAQCDVWALGCVYLVFVVWLFGGYEAVEKFADRRTAWDSYWAPGMETDSFFVIKESEKGVRTAVVKADVNAEIESLLAHNACTYTLRCFLKMVRYEMLVVQKQISADTSQVSPAALAVPETPLARRKSCGYIANVLGSLLIKSKATTDPETAYQTTDMIANMHILRDHVSKLEGSCQP